MTLGIKCFSAFLPAFILLAACSQQAIDESALRIELEKYIAEYRADKCLLIDRFPWEAPTNSESINAVPRTLRTSPPYIDKEQMEILEKNGLVRHSASATNNNARRFELTELGNKYYQELEITDTVSGRGDIGGWLCYAKVALTGDIAWRQANPNMVFVDYQIEFKDIAPWANNPDMLAAFPELEREMVPGPIAKQTKSFVRTRDGWSVALETGEIRTRVKRVK